MRQRSDAGEFEIVRLWSGGYVPFVSRTGQIELWVETDLIRRVTLNAAPGEVHYVRVTHRSWSFQPSASRLEVVDSAAGRREIARCRQLPSTAEYITQVRAAAEEGYTYKQLELGHLYATGIPYGPGEGLVKDGVEAYKWYTIVIASEWTRPEWRTQAGRGRERVATRMTPYEIGEAERLAAEWLAASLEPHR